VFVGLLVWWKQAAAKAVLVTALVLAAASGLLMVLLYDPGDTNRAYYGTDTRAAAILLGASLAAALAVWGPVRQRAGRVALEAVGWAGILVLAYAWLRVDGESAALYRGGFFLCGVAAVAVIAAAAHPEAGVLSRVLSFRPLCLLGLISYGVYLWHWPIYVVLDPERTGLDGWTLLAVRVGVTLVVAVASYVIIEQPIRHGALPARAWRVATPVLACGAVVLIIGSTRGAEPALTASGAKVDAVETVVRQAEAAPAGTERVMVVGNSVGFFLGKGMQQIDVSPPVVTLDRALVACIFPSGATHVRYGGPAGGTEPVLHDCDATWRQDVERFRPDLVFLVAQCCAAEYRYNDRWMDACDARYERMYERKLRRAIDTLGSTGARVFVTTAPYTTPDLFVAENVRTIDCTNALRRKLVPRLGGTIVDLFDWTCPDPPSCRRTIGDLVLREDGVHFRDESARIVARWLLAEAREPAPS
jgi:hypothetical protein